MKNRVWKIPWPVFCAILALLQVRTVGYVLGFGNQSVQIPMLQWLMDPGLYPGDPLVGTFQFYPSFFYRGMATLLTHAGGAAAIPGAYLLLHLVAAFLVLYAASSIARSLTGNEAVALVVVLFLMAGHQVGISEAGLYSLGFTHTWLALGLCLLALAMASSGYLLSACLFTGFIFNVHALLAAYAILFIGALQVATWRWRKLPRYMLAGLFFVGAAAPSLAMMMAQGGAAYDQGWAELLRVRSAHHVFPFSWWVAGDPQVPRFVTTVAFASLGMGVFCRNREGRRKVGAVVAVGIALFACGIFFSEYEPVAVVMRAQLFRSSQLLMVFLLCSVAVYVQGAVSLAAGPYGRRSSQASGNDVSLGLRLAIALHGVAVFLVYAIPGLEGARFVILLAGAALLLGAGVLPWWSAAAVSAALVVQVAATLQLGQPLLPECSCLLSIPRAADAFSHAGGIWVAVVGVLAVGGLVATNRSTVRALSVLCMLGLLGAGARLFPPHLELAFPGNSGDDPWADIQLASRERVPPGDTVLVPARQSGFRIHSRRAITGEWRDGTQQFFDPAYATEWYHRMELLMPGVTSEPGVGVTSPGGGIEDLSTRKLLGLCSRLGAQWVVLPTAAPRQLVECYSNAQWRLYEAREIPPPPPPPGVLDTHSWNAQEAFMQDVVLPNIERYRKGDVTLLFRHNGELPPLGISYTIQQVDSDFGFGSALELFRDTPASPQWLGCAHVTDPQLERFTELFNYSIMGYSGKWRVFEPDQGHPDFTDLDAYVDWCTSHAIRLQYHFVSGYPPNWVKTATPAQKESYLLAHAEQLIDRYGDRIRDWQVVNEKQLLRQSLPVFRLFRERLPDARLGVSDCARFYSMPTHQRHRRGRSMGRPAQVSDPRLRDLCRGIDVVDWLDGRGVKVDFFAFHAHRPFGLWADPRVVYEAFDAFAARGVRIHVSEFGIPCPAPITGNVRSGQWNRELQAAYYERIYTVMFSHPSVDVINLWGMGPKTWIKGAGLVDAEGVPNASFDVLYRLIHDKWRTRAEGEVPIDGTVHMRGFYGWYEVRVNGQPTPVARFHLAAGAEPLDVTIDPGVPPPAR